MGASNSHEYAPALQSTPPKSEKESKVLTIDPRSPTTDIVRTPIVVDKTPENTLESTVPTLDGPIDPRSPTVGIVRTPLAHIAPQKTESSALEDVPKMDLDQDLDDNTLEESTEDLQNPLIDPLSLTNLSLNDPPISESTRLVPADTDKQEYKPETDKLKKKKKARASQPKELFPTKKTSSGLKDSTRSPLSSRNVDLNSPLKIVQRKQMKDIDLKKRTCSQQESSVSRFIVKDKENM